MIENEVIPGFDLNFFKLMGFLLLGFLVIIFDRQIRIRRRNIIYFVVLAVLAMGLGVLIGIQILHPNPFIICTLFLGAIIIVSIMGSLMQ